MSTNDQQQFPTRTRPPTTNRAGLFVVGMALLLIGVGGFILLLATSAGSSVLENRGTVYACAKDSGRITALRWDGPPRCRNGQVVTWSAASQVNPTTTTTTESTTTTQGTVTYPSVTIPPPTLSLTTTSTIYPGVAESVTRPFPTWTVTP